MKKPFLALLLLVGAAAMAVSPAFAQGDDLVPAKLPISPLLKEARAQKLRTSASQAGDTLWFGHSHSNHFNAASNWYNLYSGTYAGGIDNATTAVWDFDNNLGIPGTRDSLQGWYPTRARYTGALATMTDDKVRTWGSLDAGNEVNQIVPGQARSKGVIGVWHADPGNDVAAAGNNPANPYIGWSPLSGHYSAWCGLRVLHDRVAIDPITKNAFNSEALENFGRSRATVAYGTLRNLPGYGNQWDQMLYRDFTPADNTPLSVSFLYRVRVSSSSDPGTATRAGWFHGDPLSVSAGNFISAADAGVNAPVDSFQVFAGVPVDDANCTYSNGFTSAVYDPQRRWFSEVIRLFDSPTPPVYELMSATGSVPNDTTNVPSTYSGTLSGAQVHSIVSYTGNTGGKLRLVFRVKTNRFRDDTDFNGNKMPLGSGVQAGNGYTSFGRGAALVDDITVGGVLEGDFEASSAHPINNTVGASSTANWKSTGKPAASYFHAADVQTVTWHDICGRPHSSTSHCDMAGVVADAGNLDDGDAMGDSRYPSMKEVEVGIVSPTIDLTSTNTMGIDAGHAVPTDDIYIQYDVYTGALFGSLGTGCLYIPSAFAYPVTQVNGANVWSDRIQPPFNIYNDYTGCYTENVGFYTYNMIHTTAASGHPDSLRIYWGVLQQCFVYGASVTCNSRDGGYVDNLVLGFVNTTAATVNEVGSISSDPWHWFSDAFPVNGPFGTANTPGTAGFDTTTALITGTINNAPSTGDKKRFDVLADTIVVTANNGSNATPGDTNSVDMRLDLVFRILPGPGNYQVAAGRTFPPTSAMKLLTVPSNQASFIAQPPSAGDHSFWAEFIRSPGQFSAGGHNSGQWWDYLTWNSARADSAEFNIFPVVGKSTTGLTNGVYASMYHEQDPKFSILGIDKYKCFIVDTTKAAQVDPTFDNIQCDGGHPAYLDVLPQNRTGWDGTVVTKEYTKIIPDGLLTPGSHVQYFWRKQQVFGHGGFLTDPDTLQVRPQIPEGPGLDAHRWQDFTVLPDNWKKAPWGAGLACMLYADYNDRRGDETVFISVMDSIGGTAASKWGAHNGWHAAGGVDLDAATNPTLSSVFVSNKNQSAGTIFDLYNFKGSESGSSCGTRLGNRIGVMLADQSQAGKLTGKSATSGPTPDMLAQYRIVALLTGDLGTTLLGPNTNISESDTTLFEAFIGTSTNRPRALFFQGQNFVSSERTAHAKFMSDRLGVVWRDDSYLILSGNSNACADLATVAPITTTNDVYGVLNSCSNTLDVLSLNTQIAEAAAVTTYENVGANGPYIGSILKPNVPGGREWVALTDGWDIRRQWSRYCDSDIGRLQYYYKVMSNVFASMCTVYGTPSVPLDVPQVSHFTNFMKVGNSLMRSGNATIRFGVSGTDRVRVRLYDVTGRLVRTLADRTFQANEYSLTWDGADDGGNQVARGVYFARIDYATRGASISGRVVVLR